MPWVSAGSIAISEDWSSSDVLPAGTTLIKLHGGLTGKTAWIGLHKATFQSATGLINLRPITFFTPRIIVVPIELQTLDLKLAATARYRRYLGVETNWTISVQYWQDTTNG